MYLKHYFLVFLLGSIVEFAFGQIQLLNPSFENSKDSMCFNFNVPASWSSCRPVTISNCSLTKYPEGHPTTTPHGLYILHMQSWINEKAILAQHFPCNVIGGYEYSFDVFLASYNNDVIPNFYSNPVCKIGLGNDSCTSGQNIFTSQPLDTVWQKISLNFTPTTSFSWIIIEDIFSGIGTASNLLVDTFSPISVINAYQIHAYQQDTVLPIGNNACLNLNAYADAAYDSVWWEQVGIGTISNQLNAGVHCVDTTTTFIVHIMGSDSTCAGYMPSSDTVRVKFYNPNGIGEISKAEIKIYPNPAGKQSGFFVSANQSGKARLFNTMGQLISTFTIVPGSNQVSTSAFSNGVYQLVFELDNGEIVRDRVVLQ